MTFSIDSPTRYEYADTRQPQMAIEMVEAEAAAVAGVLRTAVDQRSIVPEPSGYRITHVFQVAEDDEIPESLQYVESMDVETWEHIGSAIEVLMTRTRAEGWTVALTVVPLNLPAASVDAEGNRATLAE